MKLLISFFLFTFIACQRKQVTSDDSNLNLFRNQNSESLGIDPARVRLGAGIHTLFDRIKDDCLESPAPKKSPIAEVNYHFGSVSKILEAQVNGNGSAAVKGGYFLFKETTELEGSFNTNMGSLSYQVAVLVTYRAFSESVTDSDIHPTVKNQFFNPQSPNPADFQKKCGDKFIRTVDKGGRLVIIITFDFKDARALADFKANFGESAGIERDGADISAKVSTSMSGSGAWDNVRISLKSIGGTNVLGIIGGKDASDGSLICGPKDKGTCLTAINNALVTRIGEITNSMEANPVIIDYLPEKYRAQPDGIEKATPIAELIKNQGKLLDEMEVRKLHPNVLTYHKHQLEKFIEIGNQNMQKLENSYYLCLKSQGTNPVCTSPTSTPGYVEIINNPSVKRFNKIPATREVAVVASRSQAWSQTCPNREFPIGIAGTNDKTVVGSVGLICSGQPTTSLAQVPTNVKLLGSFSFKCDDNAPNDWLITGINYSTGSTNQIFSLGAVCTNKKQLLSGAKNPAKKNVQGVGSTDRSASCPPGYAVKSFTFNEDNGKIYYGLKGLQLECVEVPTFPSSCQ